MNELYPNTTPQVPVPVRNVDVAVGGQPIEYARETEGLDLHECWRVIKKHRRLIRLFFLTTIVTAVAVLLMTSPLYTAKTTLLIERNDLHVVDIKQVLSEPLGPDEHDYYKTQYEILKSRSLAAEVISQQGLEKHPLFTKGEQEAIVAALWTDLKERIREWVPMQDHRSQETSVGPEPALVDRYIKDMLQVEPVNGTRLTHISFTSPDANLSARVANAHAEVYIRHGLKLRSEASREAHKFLDEKLVELKDRVEKSEEALNSYRKDKGILALDTKENIVVERLADLNKRLTEAEIETIALESHVRLIRKRDYDSLPAVIASPLVTTLKEQLTRLQSEYANLSTQFKAGYPRMAQLKAGLEETQLRVKQEIEKIVGGIESAYMAAQARERELRARTEEQKTAALELKDASVDYAILDREVETNRQLYDSVLGRIKEIGVTAQLPTSNVFVIDSAYPPATPSSPRMKLSLLLAGFLGLTGAIGLAFLREHLDKTLKTPEEAERYLSLPNLGFVPNFLSSNHRLWGRATVNGRGALPRNGNGSSDSEIVFYPCNPKEKPVFSFYPFGAGNEAYRTLRTGILLSDASQAGEAPRTVLFTSAVHGEGKTATVVNTAITFAQMGVRVLLIDADLRRPRCHKILGLRRGPGISELLGGEIKPTWAIQPTHVDNLFFISSGSEAPNPTELIGSRRMRETLLLVRQHYGYILIDSPPTMAVSDAVLLSTMVDGVVLVIGGQETPRDVVKQACSRLRYARAKILGMVLNRLDPRREGYRDSDYAYESYSDAGIKRA